MAFIDTIKEVLEIEASALLAGIQNQQIQNQQISTQNQQPNAKNHQSNPESQTNQPNTKSQNNQPNPESKNQELSAESQSAKLDSIIEIILDSTKKGGRLIITGVGKSGLVGAKIAATLSSTGTPSAFLHPTEALHGDLGSIQKHDAVLAISYSGESPELLAIAPHLLRLSSALITMSRAKNTALSALSPYFLNIAVAREACPLNTAPTASTTLTLALGDALAVALMKKRGFSTQDFASFHPGGALGKRLFVRLRDLMRTENLPIIFESTPLKEAIITMSEGKLGTAIVLDSQQRVVAILSDGDLRRAMMRKDFSMEDAAIKHATTAPKTCKSPDMLAFDALEFIETNKIQLLLVCDGGGKLLGAAHIHDLVAAGIKR